MEEKTAQRLIYLKRKPKEEDRRRELVGSEIEKNGTYT
jgi:hypothetical protein